jgi:pimeloyl-ACP methyl ester carboxylesterase
MTQNSLIEEEIYQLAYRLFGEDKHKRAVFSETLLDMYNRAQNNHFLLIHNPGGWGSTRIENLLQWERSIIEGVDKTIKKLGYRGELMQYFRSATGLRAVLNDIREQYHFFAGKAKIMAEQIEFITRHLDNLKIVMIGVSQGAAFSNAVQQYLDGADRVFSIELGTPFFYKSKRVVTDRTLTLDGNGLMPDALMEWNVPVILKTYFSAPFRWLKYKLQGKHIKFTYCINLPGHDYNWDYPEVQRQIEEFLILKFGHNSDVEVAAQ